MDNVIEIDLDSREEYINKYDDKRLSDTLHNYIRDSLFDIRKDVVIHVRFNYFVLNKEKKKFKEMLHDNFKESIREIDFEVKKIHYQCFGLAILGLFLFCLSNFFEYNGVSFMSELCMIFTWVAFWEVAENILFVRRKWRIRKFRYQKLLEAKIEM